MIPACAALLLPWQAVSSAGFVKRAGEAWKRHSYDVVRPSEGEDGPQAVFVAPRPAVSPPKRWTSEPEYVTTGLVVCKCKWSSN